MNLDKANTIVVIRNRIRPSSNKADFCIPPASLNSLARAEAIALEGEKMEFGILKALPITKVTAMVSPSALPSPSLMPPIRSEARTVGKEGVSTCRSRGSPDHYKKNKNRRQGRK